MHEAAFSRHPPTIILLSPTVVGVGKALVGD